MKKLIIVVIAVLALIAGYLFWGKKNVQSITSESIVNNAVKTVEKIKSGSEVNQEDAEELKKILDSIITE